jgi:hypothetical protein
MLYKCHMLCEHHLLRTLCYDDSEVYADREFARLQNVREYIGYNVYFSTELLMYYSFSKEIIALVLPIAHRSITFSIVRALTDKIFINLLCYSIIEVNSVT